MEKKWPKDMIPHDGSTSQNLKDVTKSSDKTLGMYCYSYFIICNDYFWNNKHLVLLVEVLDPFLLQFDQIF